MLRTLAAPVLAGVFSLASVLPALADAQALSQVLKLPEVVEILHGEGMEYAESIEREMLPGGGGGFWAHIPQVAR